MQIWRAHDSGVQRVSILLFDQFSNHCLANAMEPFRAANEFAGRRVYDWQILTVDGGDVTSSSGLRMAVETALRDAAGDILLVMPSYEFLRHCTVSTRRALQSAARRFPLIAGLDTGSWLLAQAGLLDGYCATIHWDEVDRFSEEFTQVDVRLDRVVQDRDRITCGGASTAFDLTMALIGQRHGQALRLQVEGLFSGMQSDRPQAMHGPVAQAVQVMRANLEDPLPINVIAQHIGRTQRDLEGRMKVQMGATPQAVYRHLRLTQARRLAKDTMMPVVEIAVRCGYRDASAMTRAFRAEFGTTPQALRRP